MGAKRSGGTAGRLRAANSAMAARLKAEGNTRHVMRCPMCHRLIAIVSQYGHLGACKGR